MMITLNHELPNQSVPPSRRRWSATCICGRVWESRLDHLKRPTANCGCRNKGSFKHGYTAKDSRYKALHSQWRGMFKRSKQRDDCEVTGEWLDFENFLGDALEAGWSETNKLWVCRKHDKGDYCRDNTYFGTRSDNTSDTWEFGGRS